MSLITEIRDKISRDLFEFSRHATDHLILREISVDDVRNAVKTGEIIENYPQDKYGPSCLILGFSKTGKPVHVQCSYPDRPLVKVITVYEPDPHEWVDFRVRR